GCNPAYSKSIHTWLRFGEIMRGSLRAEFLNDAYDDVNLYARIIDS
ncbi:50S ribosomal protein L7/L12-serine acetyltransferase, partial [Escherichia coli]